MLTDRPNKRHSPNSAFELWLEFELWQPRPEIGPQVNKFDPEDDFCNITITFATGERYALNVWTFNYLAHARQDDRADGDGITGNGKYLLPPDLFVERLDRHLLEEIVADLIRRDTLRAEWRCDTEDDL
jgi:hypothetical protein